MTSTSFITNLILKAADIYLRTPDPFDLNCLVCKYDQEPMTATEVLLPRLEDFELYRTQESDDTVLKFIISRMGTLLNVSVLKNVKIIFARPKETGHVDIQEHVRAHSMKTGVQIKLNLQYSTPLHQMEGYVDPLSPSYISNRAYNIGTVTTDHTWDFEEMNDDEDDGFVEF